MRLQKCLAQDLAWETLLSLRAKGFVQGMSLHIVPHNTHTEFKT